MSISFDMLPQSILKIVKDKRFRVTHMGMSGAEVRIYDDFVLKVQPHTEASVNEAEFMRFLNGAITAPEIVAYDTQGGFDFLLMTRLKGRMLCEQLSNPVKLFEKSAEVLYKLWSIPARQCPIDMSLAVKLRIAERNVNQNLVDMDNVNPNTFGKNGRFKNPEKLLQWLKDNKIDEDTVVSHGDLCLPNIIDCGEEVGIIDFPYGGRADRYCDIALLYRSSRGNLLGKYGGKAYGFDEQLFFSVLSLTPDRDKIDYYIFLDELF